MLSDNKETYHGSSNQEDSLSAGKNSRAVLVLCCTWKCVPVAIPGGEHISEIPGHHFYNRLVYIEGHKTSRNGVP